MIRRGHPISREPDQRYWRRRANRRVRKARWTRNVFRWSLLLAAHLLIAGILLYGGVRAFRQLITTPEFALQRIEIAGLHRASEEDIRSQLSRYLGRNLLDLNLSEIAMAAAQDPWVLSASAKRILPRTVRLTLDERVPSAIALIGGIAHVVDETGYVVGPSGPAVVRDLPVLTGLAGREGQELVVALRRGVRMIDRLRGTAADWVSEISELDLSLDDRVELRTVDPGPTILLDPERVERNIPAYLELRREIDRRVGTVKYVDLRWQDRISVMPASRIPLEGS